MCFIFISVYLLSCSHQQISHLPQSWIPSTADKKQTCLDISGIYANKGIGAPENEPKRLHVYLSDFIVSYKLEDGLKDRWITHMQVIQDKNTLTFLLIKKDEVVQSMELKQGEGYTCSTDSIAFKPSSYSRTYKIGGGGNETTYLFLQKLKDQSLLLKKIETDKGLLLPLLIPVPYSIKTALFYKFPADTVQIKHKQQMRKPKQQQAVQLSLGDEVYYQEPLEVSPHAILKISLVDGGLLNPDQPVVSVEAINGWFVEENQWGGFGHRSFIIPVGFVIIEAKERFNGDSGYVAFKAKLGEAYTLSYKHFKKTYFELQVKDAAGVEQARRRFPVQDIHYDASDAYEQLNDAIAFHDINTAKALLENGVNPNLDFSGEPFSIVLATRENDMDMLKLLLKHGALLDGEVGVFAMRNALQNNNLDIMKTLMDNGADINYRYRNISLLMDAAAQGNAAFVELLLSHGAFEQYRNGQGQTALFLAKAAKHQDVVALFKKH